MLTVAPQTSSSLWGDWINRDLGTRCTGDEPSLPGRLCVHAGEALQAVLPLDVTCADVSAIGDELGAFGWECVDEDLASFARATGLRAEKGLSDLVDRPGVAFHDNRLFIDLIGSDDLESDSAVWWTNAVVQENDGVIATPNVIALLPADFSGLVTVNEDGVSVLSVGANANVEIFGRERVWIEGPFTGVNPLEEAVDIEFSALITLRHVDLRHGAQGLDIGDTNALMLSDAVIQLNDTEGVILRNVTFVVLQRVTSARNDDVGLVVDSTSDCIL